MRVIDFRLKWCRELWTSALGSQVGYNCSEGMPCLCRPQSRGEDLATEFVSLVVAYSEHGGAGKAPCLKNLGSVAESSAFLDLPFSIVVSPGSEADGGDVREGEVPQGLAREGLAWRRARAWSLDSWSSRSESPNETAACSKAYRRHFVRLKCRRSGRFPPFGGFAT